MNIEGNFYLGRVVEAETGAVGERPLHYDPNDLTTHAVVVGMTGSGKTGLCLDLLEEAALNQIPALMIDPKGDITNALLHFPHCQPADFLPWMNVSEARRSGQTIEEAAAATADLWRKGLADWDIGLERVQALQDSVQFAIYTPGSDAGLPLSILASLQAPAIPWQENREILREKIASTVTGLLGLVGLKDIDPVRSREHILLANIFEQAWSQGQDLDLAQLILQTQSPPFARLGVFEVDTFFPEKDRFELAMMLNNILAAPTFQAWIEGEPLDIWRLLWTENGRPRHTIFYIAHLSDAERMFFVTLLYGAVETWMRAQQGSANLRALVYFDEIFGYLPPVSNPPSKPLLLRLLKQARAFGVGLVLATQNPADIDYKALSNAGTWFVGKLATEQDKNRLLDGLLSAGDALDRRQYDELISRLDKRVFLLRNVHEAQPQLFHTRWAMNYLAGPVTRAQIGALNELGSVESGGESVESGGGRVKRQEESEPLSPLPSPLSPSPASRPAVPRGISEYFLPVNRPFADEVAEVIYYPVLLAQAEVRFSHRKYELDVVRRQAAVVLEVAEGERVAWDDYALASFDGALVVEDGGVNGRFQPLPPALENGQLLRSLKSDFEEWVYRTAEVRVKANETLKVYAAPDVSEADFRQKCVAAARPLAQTEIEKLEAQFDKREAAIQQKLTKEERELAQDKEELSLRKREGTLTHAETFFSLFSRRRRSLSTSMNKRRMTQRAKADVEESEDVIRELQAEMERLEAEEETAKLELQRKWVAIVDEVGEVVVKPFKKDVQTAVFGIAWFPYCVVKGEEVAGFITE
ncbi:MAG: ATP-binding protein [Ardenticatenaceae bacterium]|nr:ATP-binding protein [Ardenticatenaceae bacterium]